jgi:cathepsin B
MKVATTAIAVLAGAMSVSGTRVEAGDEITPLNLLRVAEQVNVMDTTWKAAVNARFSNATLADAKRLLGTILPGEEGYVTIPAKMFPERFEEELPQSFDARVGFPQCAKVIGNIRDQSNCGSCWAFSGVEAFNDRLCIVHGEDRLMSPEDTVSCCTGRVCSFSAGCNGGQQGGAWNWFMEEGVSSGGDWADNGEGTSCKPYSMQSCAHHVEPTGDMVACEDVETYTTPKCTSTCSEESYVKDYASDKHFAKSVYSIEGEDNIRREIFEHGSISVAMSVFEDFESYSSGVYQHVTGQYLGGHAIKMIGWGMDDGVKFWICVNSWNDSWGEYGTFRILRGSNECGIEGSCVAGDVA